MISNTLAESVDNEVRQLYEWYQAAESDAERRNIFLEMEELTDAATQRSTRHSKTSEPARF
ncbi:hypothetical protein C489_18426 [Natrinema versiforme JCM 10478]|uniref:Uncharacterized protein n=1 Tax=Natrinema versiforme JCM 10478 TaxID=1227496 RepID=L9XQ95_9EURY|nr:hypothetical protein C489_18426 [Natrinema versiforme JCM 10478]